METPGGPSPSAARSFSASEIAELVALAAGLPEGWCVQIVPPHAQVSITPTRGGTPWFHDALVVARDGRAGPARVTSM